MLRKPKYFPPPEHADHDGLVAMNPKINVARMLDAYSHGIFPWPWSFEGHWYVGWHSPDPRAIISSETLHLPKRLARKLRTEKFRFTWNTAFDKVLDSCATVGNRRNQRWLSPPLMKTIRELSRRGNACSIEVYSSDDDYREICGGLYGVCVGGQISAESMFHHKSDASKAAVCALVRLASGIGYSLIDIQQSSDHLTALGAVEVPRSDYLVATERAVAIQVQWPDCAGPVSFEDLGNL